MTAEVEEDVGVLPVDPTVVTTEVEEDVDGGPPGGHCRWVHQQPPLSLKRTSMVDPLGALSVGPTAATTEVEDDVNGGPSGRC
jgi:hypothetical protein